MMYTWRGAPLSLYVLPENTGHDQVVRKMGHEAVIWCANQRTYAVVADGQPPQDLHPDRRIHEGARHDEITLDYRGRRGAVARHPHAADAARPERRRRADSAATRTRAAARTPSCDAEGVATYDFVLKDQHNVP